MAAHATQAGLPRAAPTTWSSPCTNWPPTRSGTAPGTAGSGSGGRTRPCTARSATTASRSRKSPRTQQSPRSRKAPEPQKPRSEAPRAAKPPDAPQWRTEPGHGLSLVRQVADHTSLRSGRNGTSATISFALAASGPPFHLAQHDTDGCTVLTVTGPLDLDSAAQLNQAIEHLISETPALKLVLDLTNLTGWDSAGLAALITAQQQISATPNARMILAGLPAHLEQHLRQAHLKDRFTLADSQTQAAKAISDP